MSKSIPILLVFIASLVTSCGQKNDYVVTISTDYGDMIAILYDETPKHKENFIKLAQEHYFDSLLFHRVMKGFMIQGGDPDSKHAAPGQHLGTGGPDYTIEAEFNPKFFHRKGALCAARQSDQMNPTKASSGSQFYVVQGTVIPPESADELKVDSRKLNAAMQKFMQDPANQNDIDSLSKVYYTGDQEAYKVALFAMIPRIEKSTGLTVTKDVPQERIDAYTTVGGAPHLDGDYTVFGQVIQGMDVIDKIAEQQVDPANRPVQDIRMKVKVESMSRKKITKLYGYEFPPKK